MDYKRLDGETDFEWKLRLCKAKVKKEITLSWQDIVDTLDLGISADKLRHDAYAYVEYGDYVDEKKKDFSDDDYLKQVEEKERELERKKIQLRDERSAWQKQNYIAARVEHKLDLLEKELSSQGKINFDIHDDVNIASNNDLLVILSDFHIGQCFESAWGEYNSDIAKKRLNQLLDEVISIQKLHNCENCYVSLQGDMLSGNIHKSIQVTNRENVIDQIKITSELISSFCYELTKEFNCVFLSSVVGNHSRMDRKDEALHDERLDDVITWSIELSLNHIDNFHVLKRNLDNGIADMNIRGKTYIAVHGDFDGYNKTGVSNLCMHLGFIPYAITYGHLHTCAVDETNGVKMIRGGSLAGSGDDYTIEKRLSGKASQMVCVCDNTGVKCYYPIELN